MIFNYNLGVVSNLANGAQASDAPRGRLRWPRCAAAVLAMSAAVAQGAAAQGASPAPNPDSAPAAQNATDGASPVAGPGDPVDPAAPAAEPGTIAGQVLLPGPQGRPAIGATVVVEDATGEIARVETDAQGRFRAGALIAGTYVLTVLGAGGEQTTRRVDVTAGHTAEATLRLEATGAAETIVVRGLTEVTRRRQSADAVTIVDTEHAKRATADLGDVLARTQGVGVRRGGGLGSSAQLSLGGLIDDQIRFFLDGIPLELAGYPFGISNVPVNLVERIEIYNGVVPIRFGADALGGGINLVTNQDVGGTHGGASYEVGSFGTDRLTLSGRHFDAPSGVFVRVDGFFDRARNNYPITVKVPDDLGQLSPTLVHRFHDRYLAGGGAAEVGVSDVSWAKRLTLRGFASGFDKQYQSNQTMNRVYGDVSDGERAGGGSVRYEQPLGRDISLDATAGYSFTRGRYLDTSPCIYDWFGHCFMQDAPGEIDQMPHDRVSWEHAVFARLYTGWSARPGHALRLSVAPTYVTRSANEHLDNIPADRDPLSAQRDLTTIVSGLEYQVDLFGDRLENIAFVKHYFQHQASEEPGFGDMVIRRDRTTQRPGVGDALRYRFSDWLYAKASYEWATRLPRPDEVFGDSAFIKPNLVLDPESSHNLNLGVTVDGVHTPVGVVGATATGFLREVDHLISLFGNDDDQTYQNVYGARSLGVEAAASWTSPGDHLTLDGNATYQDFRNNSSAGQFGSFKGDRIPNHPYLFASVGARFKLHAVVLPRDEVVVSFGSRYVHSFFVGWESAGTPESKQTIDAQLVHSLGASYVVRGDRVGVTTTIEVSNLTDERVFDFYGVQRPGRAVYLKTALDF